MLNILRPPTINGWDSLELLCPRKLATQPKHKNTGVTKISVERSLISRDSSDVS